MPDPTAQAITLGPSLASTGPAVPVTTTMVPATPVVKGPNELALDADMAAAGVTTDAQAAAFLSALDGNPAPQFLDESSSAYYLGLIQQQQEATYLKWGIGAAVVVAAGFFLLD
jgi:hypothetical protein